MRRYKRHLLLSILLTLYGCMPAYLHISDTEIYVKKDLFPHSGSAKIIVLPFESTAYDPGIGTCTAKLFYERLLKQKEFNEVIFLQASDWYEKGRSLMDKNARAVQLGRELQSEYVLVGSIDYYLVGHITPSRVTVTARLLATATGETLYYVTGCGSGKPGKTFFPLDLKAGEAAPSASSVLYAVVDKMIKNYFDGTYL